MSYSHAYWRLCTAGHLTVNNPQFPRCPVVEEHPPGEPGRAVHPNRARCFAECRRLPDHIADLLDAAVMLGGLQAAYVLIAAEYPEARRPWHKS